MTQTTLFDAPKAEEKKREGMRVSAGVRKHVLKLARSFAKRIAISKPGRLVTADDVQEELILHGYEPHILGNAAGSIFNDGAWQRIGMVKSKRVSNHARWIAQWRLK